MSFSHRRESREAAVDCCAGLFQPPGSPIPPEADLRSWGENREIGGHPQTLDKGALPLCTLQTCHCGPFSRPSEEKARQSTRLSDHITPPRDCFVASLLAMTPARSWGSPLILRRVYDQTLGPPQADHSRGACPRGNGERESREAAVDCCAGLFQPPGSPIPPEADLRSWGNWKEEPRDTLRLPAKGLRPSAHLGGWPGRSEACP